jgi:hypothetical protein
MNFSYPVRIAKPGLRRQVDCFWATPPALAETALLNTWSARTDDVKANDAAEFAKLATQKWELTNRFGTVVGSIAELEAAVHEEPKAEVTAMLLAGAPWFDASLIGMCLFHRTWANNIFIDYISAHPDCFAESEPISGVGPGLLFLVCEAALRLNCATIWAETTPTSALSYQEFFKAPEATDRLVVDQKMMTAFRDSMSEKWRSPAGP